MFSTDDLEIWNLTPGGTARCGSVSIFNVVGRLKHPHRVRSAHYGLNGAPDVPIFFGRTEDELPLRLGAPGEFNIDTISLDALEADNVIRFRLVDQDGSISTSELTFRTSPFRGETPSFRLDLNSATTAEEVGQIVEGPWRISVDENGRRCLEIDPDDTGYDRIILFGRHDWTTGYEVTARFSVTALTGMHNIGLIFKWNPHLRGDGAWLPSQWSTGLGYYCSYGKPGVRIRFGVDVHRTPEGVKVGDHLLGHAHLGRARYRLTWMANKLVRSVQPTEMVLHQDYRCRLRVDPDQYALTMWNPTEAAGGNGTAAGGEPSPQVVVDHPTDLLPQGSVGFIAHQAGIRIYEYEVRPLAESGSRPSPTRGPGDHGTASR